MMDNCLQRYLDKFEQVRSDAGADAQDQFLALITEALRELHTKSTTVFFPEVWSLSNHDEYATVLMDSMYGKSRDALNEVIARINPALSPDQLGRLALFISSSIEGHTMFIGHKKL